MLQTPFTYNCVIRNIVPVAWQLYVACLSMMRLVLSGAKYVEPVATDQINLKCGLRGSEILNCDLSCRFRCYSENYISGKYSQIK